MAACWAPLPARAQDGGGSARCRQAEVRREVPRDEKRSSRITRKMMTEGTRFCKNCKRDVSAANFSLHEAHCLRFLTLCSECNEPVAKKHMKDHQTEAHKQNNCSATHSLIEVPVGQSTSKPISDSPPSSSSLAPFSGSARKDISPRGKKREHPLTSKSLLKPPKKKKVVGIHSPTGSKLSTSPQVLKDTQSHSMLVTCAHCNTPLPLPALQKHEIKCLNFVSLKNVKMNQKPRSGKKEDSS
ncbi:XIAP-associated factor 1 isoform X2 [Excalfactoria chinensis]|uniref:XIAP-associated factor 1 isoform X2 n=2 Tax=Excalfactoria chinensis TaxID=46218 RepID=UPI003B3B5447